MHDRNRLVGVATIHDDREVIKHVGAVLHRQGIQAALIAVTGAVGVYVRHTDCRRALAILRQDSHRHHYWILLARCR